MCVAMALIQTIPFLHTARKSFIIDFSFQSYVFFRVHFFPHFHNISIFGYKTESEWHSRMGLLDCNVDAFFRLWKRNHFFGVCYANSFKQFHEKIKSHLTEPTNAWWSCINRDKIGHHEYCLSIQTVTYLLIYNW